MKVLHVLKSDKFSGAENVVCQMISMFSEQNNVDMAYASKDGNIRESLEQRKINFIPMEKLTINEIKRVISEYQPDIIHAHDFSASILCTMATKLPIISHIHNNAPWIKKVGIHSIQYALTCHCYKKILLVSDAIEKEYVFSRFFRKKMLNMGNPINVKEVRKKAIEYNLQSSYDVIFLGRLVEEKNPIRFINIIYELKKEFSDIRAILVGTGVLKEYCENLILERKLEDNIEIIGFKGNPYPYLNISKILCNTSCYEGFGLVAIEAMCLQKPVVAANVGGLRNIIDDSCGKRCNSDEDYINEIKKLLVDNQYYDAKSKNAVQKAETYDNIVEYRRKLYDIYVSLKGR